MSLDMDLEIYKDIPGYKGILKAVLKSQIQMLVEQLANQTGEESVVLSASVTDGTLSHLGTESGKDFLRGHEEIKKQFLGFCLKRQQKRKPEETYSSSHKRFAVSSSLFGSAESDVPATVTEAVESSPLSSHHVKRVPLRKRGTYLHPRPTESFSQLSSHFKLSSLSKDTHRKDPYERGDNTSRFNDSPNFEGVDKFDNSGGVSTASYSPSQTGYIPEIDHIPVPVSLEKQPDNDGGNEAGLDFTTNEPVRVKVEVQDEPDEHTEEDGSSVVKSNESQMYMSRLGPESLPSQMGSAEDGNFAENESQSYDYVLNQGKELESSLSWKQENNPLVSVPFTSKRKQLLPAKLRKNYGGRGQNLEQKGSEIFGSDMNESGNDGEMAEHVSGHEMEINSYSKDEVDSSSWMYENAKTPSPSSHTNHAPASDGAVGYMSDSFNAGMQRKYGKLAVKVEKNGLLSQVKDGAFVSRGEGRYEKLIKCELCGKVCRTSNMARHKKRYCLASTGMSGGNTSLDTSGSGVISESDGCGSTSYSYMYSSPMSYSST